jgi:glycosyltransferase involved in cell wall biosynthesis
MKVLMIHNRHAFRGGEDTVVEITAELLRRRQVQIHIERAESPLLKGEPFGKIKGFARGIYSPSAYRYVLSLIEREMPDVVHVHSRLPLFSPSALVGLKQANVPVVMTCHDFGLICPTSDHFSRGKACESCNGGKEYWCVLKNCKGNILESFAYAIRSALARRQRIYHKTVTLFIVLTQFAKKCLVASGFNESQIVILPNMIKIQDTAVAPGQGQYVAFAGRMTPEKGVETLLEAAAELPELRVRLAGDGPILSKVSKTAPPNSTFLGRLDSQKMWEFYRNSRFLVLPSLWFEMCPMVILEAMGHGLPVIASRIGGLAEIVEDGVTGLLFETGSSEDLRNKMKLLWQNPDLCLLMGQAARKKAMREYSEEIYYKRLMVIYEKAIMLQRQISVR